MKSSGNIDAVDFVSVKFTNWPQVYTLFISGDIDRPLSREGRPVFFQDRTKLSEAKALLTPGEARLLKTPARPFLICDMKTAAMNVSNGVDSEHLALHSINFALDCVNFIGKRIPLQQEECLFALADSLSFNKRIPTKFVEKSEFVKQSLLWCQFAITNESVFLEDTSRRNTTSNSPLVHKVRA
jgi:hypothetical protein